MQFQASVHGAELKGDSPPTEKASTTHQSEDEQIPLFGNPEDFSHLSEEVRQQRTEHMKTKHTAWSQNPLSK
jgi:hypothetical protein